MVQLHRVLIAFCFVIGTSVASNVLAQDDADANDPIVIELDRRVEQFFERIAEGDHDNAFPSLLLRSQLLDQEDELQALIDASKQIETRYGAYRGSEQIGAQRVGTDLILLKYLFKCERFPVVWYVAFYRQPATANSVDRDWAVISLSFDTRIQRLFN